MTKRLEMICVSVVNSTIHNFGSELMVSKKVGRRRFCKQVWKTGKRKGNKEDSRWD